MWFEWYKSSNDNMVEAQLCEINCKSVNLKLNVKIDSVFSCMLNRLNQNALCQCNGSRPIANILSWNIKMICTLNVSKLDSVFSFI